jgi:hypothetical protein
MVNLKINLPAELSAKNGRLLAENRYLWDNWVYGFRRMRDAPSQPTAEYLASTPDIISFEELTAHGCFAPVPLYINVGNQRFGLRPA